MGKTNKELFSSYLYRITRFYMSYDILLHIAYGFDIFNYKAIVTPWLSIGDCSKDILCFTD